MYKEIISNNNLYEFPDGLDTAAIVTTNGIVKCGDEAVMGAGIAKYVNDTWDHLPAEWLGNVSELLAITHFIWATCL